MLKITGLSRNNRFVILFVMLVLTICFTAYAEWAKRFDHRLSDQFIRHQAQTLDTDPEIHILNIDDYSAVNLSPYLGKFPWPRAVYAELLDWIDGDKVQAIVFDLIFSERDERMPMSDAAFNDAIGQSNKVYFAAIETNADKGNSVLKELAKSAGITPSPEADMNATAGLVFPWAVELKYWKIGAINFHADSDGVGRRYKTYRNLSGWHFPTLPSRVARDLNQTQMLENDFIMKWKGGVSQPFSECSFFDVYSVLIEGKEVPDAAVHCRDEKALINWLNTGVLIIGNTSAGIEDFRKTPIDDFYPGVYLLATAIDNLKNNNSIKTVPEFLQILLLVLPIISLCFLFFSHRQSYKTQVIRGSIFVIMISSIYLLLSYLFLSMSILIPVAYSSGAFIVSLSLLVLVRGLEEHLDRQKTVKVFNRFMDPEVVNELLGKGELKDTLDNKSIEITVLFSDIRGFTTLSEKHDAETIVRLLNLYFSRQVKAIFRYGGTLDKFIGDAVMAFWGAPLDCADQAEKAVSAALDMEIELELFKEEVGELGIDFDIGIGIHTGMAVVGMIGSEQRSDYTCIGDSVNLASRIEGVTKGVSRILVSEATKQRCGVGFDFVEKGSYKVKGREQLVKLYAPIRRGDET
jgi:adenylate cyclase